MVVHGNGSDLGQSVARARRLLRCLRRLMVDSDFLLGQMLRIVVEQRQL